MGRHRRMLLAVTRQVAPTVAHGPTVCYRGLHLVGTLIGHVHRSGRPPPPAASSKIEGRSDAQLLDVAPGGPAWPRPPRSPPPRADLEEGVHREEAAAKKTTAASSPSSNGGGDLRDAVVVGGNRIPFARSNGAYANASQPGHAHRGARRARRPVRAGRRAPGRGRRRGGAQAQPRLQPRARVGARHRAGRGHPGLRRAEGLRHLARGHRRGGQQDPPGPDRRRHRLRCRHDLGRAGRRQRRAAADPDGRQPRLGAAGLRQAARAPAPRPARPRDPAQQRAAHRPVDGRAPGHHDRGVGHPARGPGRAGHRQPRQPRGRLRPRVHGRPRHPVPRACSATTTCAPAPASRSSASSSPSSATPRPAP